MEQSKSEIKTLAYLTPGEVLVLFSTEDSIFSWEMTWSHPRSRKNITSTTNNSVSNFSSPQASFCYQFSTAKLNSVLFQKRIYSQSISGFSGNHHAWHIVGTHKYSLSECNLLFSDRFDLNIHISIQSITPFQSHNSNLELTPSLRNQSNISANLFHL